jgi:hypothetical protein
MHRRSLHAPTPLSLVPPRSVTFRLFAVACARSCLILENKGINVHNGCACHWDTASDGIQVSVGSVWRVVVVEEELEEHGAEGLLCGCPQCFLLPPRACLPARHFFCPTAGLSSARQTTRRRCCGFVLGCAIACRFGGTCDFTPRLTAQFDFVTPVLRVQVLTFSLSPALACFCVCVRMRCGCPMRSRSW